MGIIRSIAIVGTLLGATALGAFGGSRIRPEHTVEDVLKQPTRTGAYSRVSDVENLLNVEKALVKAQGAFDDGFVSQEELFGKKKGLGKLYGSNFDFFVWTGYPQAEKGRRRPVNEDDFHYEKMKGLVGDCKTSVTGQLNNMHSVGLYHKSLVSLAENEGLEPHEQRQLREIAGNYSQRHLEFKVGVRGDSELGKQLASVVADYRSFLEELRSGGYFDSMVQAEIRSRDINEVMFGAFAGGISGAVLGAFICYVYSISRRKEDPPKAPKATAA